MDNIKEDIKTLQTSINQEERKKVITKKINTYSLDEIFMFLNEKEKEIYCHHLSSTSLKEYIKKTKNNNEIIDYIIENRKHLKIDSHKAYILSTLLTDKEKLKILKECNNFITPHFYTKIITTIEDETLKIKLLKSIITISNLKCYTIDIVKSFESDQTKEIFLDYFETKDQVTIIMSFKNKDLIKEYIKDEKYKDYKTQLIFATEDTEYIKQTFKETKADILKQNIIKRVKNKDIKLELLETTGNKNAIYFYRSNLDRYYSDYISELNEEEIKSSNIDERITIGTELEIMNQDINNYKYLGTVLKNYTIQPEITVKNGIEIVSPVIHYTKKDLQELKAVCEILQKCNFKTGKQTGGHIHIGASYLTEPKDYFMLLYLYSNCENIIYLITDRKNTKKRKSIEQYAQKVKKEYIKAFDRKIIHEHQSLEGLTETLSILTDSRYKGLNLRNITSKDKETIEFRMPNGEIDFNELLANIKLFAKIVQKSHELNQTKEKDLEIELLSKKINEKLRLELLLDILFDNETEKQVYVDRYRANKSLIDIINKEVFRQQKLFQINIDTKELVRTRKKKG